MTKVKTRRLVYNFQNTCNNCFNDIEFPILGEFGYGEVMFQTTDAIEFHIAVLIKNKALEVVTDVLKQDLQKLNTGVDLIKVLALLADKINDKEFTTEYPICPICKASQQSYGDAVRTTLIEVGYVSWLEFEGLNREEKVRRVKELVAKLT